MKKTTQLLLTLLALSFYPSAAAQTEHALHPAPRDPQFLKKDRLSSLQRNISPPPAADSAAQKRDEEKLRAFQRDRTKADCARAATEVYVSLASFYGAPFGNLTKREVEILGPVFEQIRNDADYYIQLLKKEFPRQRPFLYLPELTPCVPKEVTGAYPSGHATLARLYALLLKDIFPSRSSRFESRSQTIGNDRILSGMHHPSDVEAGQRLGEALYLEFKSSPEFQRLLNDALIKLRTEPTPRAG